MKADPSYFHFEPLGNHDRAAFSCGYKELDDYIRNQASQDLRRNLAAVFVIVRNDNAQKVIGYYTLSPRHLQLEQLPKEIAKKAGKYNTVGVTLLGRMAVDSSQQGQGIGELVLLEALKQCLLGTERVASFAVFVEAKDEKAAGFYRKYGFIELPKDKRKLFLPMKTIARLPLK
ncbi:MAG TPA: GNAT family N-acetyltransferase [Terriglobales bacterium]|nr:GNAT family N-acetyltransferase [Terriglobales bacterium]